MSGFTSKVGELIADYKHRLMDGIENFKLGLKSLQANLMSLSAKASDVEKEIKNVEISGRIKRKREVEEWLKAVRSIEKEVVELGAKVESEGIKSVIDGGQVTRLNEEVVKLHEQSQDFGTMAVDVYGIVRGETSLTSGLVGKSFNENLETILELLNSGKVSSVGVYGMGGVGKTTLAKHIYNRLIQQCKGRVLWVTVSQEFSVTSLQDKIALLVGSDLSDKDNEEERAVRLCAALSQMKNSTLILDDVWEKIDISKIGCPVSVEYCRLIVTSRSLTVCHQLGCQKLIRVEKLCEDEAWRLFSETLQIEINLSPQVEEVAKSVAKLCDGLPLGVITLGGIMRGERSVHTWRNALVELKERVSGKDGMELEEVFEVLKFSFDRLNTNYRENREFNTVQLCFLYCVLYPEDYQIYRDDLVRGFLSEGLMDERRSWRAQVDQGHAILDKLVNVGLLESCVAYHGVEFVRMHDLVRGMAMKICEGKFMVNAGNPSLTDIYDEGEWTEDLEKVSLMRNGIRTIGDGTSPNCPRLSTLLLRENPFTAIPDSFLSRMHGLSTLDLCMTYITMLPESVAGLINLKSLLVEDCYKLVKVPYLGKLKGLRELNLSHTAIEEVPQGVEELLNLRFLSLDSHKLKTLPRGWLFKFRHLQCVKYPVHIQASIEEVEHLKQLEQFWGALNSIHDFNCFIKSRVHDAFYKILVGPSPFLVGEWFQAYYEREASLLKCDLKGEKVLGGDIEGLRIRECEGLRYCLSDVFSPSSYPKSLRRLRIQRCRELERISTSEEQSLLLNLEYIELEELEDLKELFQPSAAPMPSTFSSLMCLIISRCNKITKLRLPALGVPNLEEITISTCGEMEEIFDDEENSLASLPRLKQLSLYELPRLDSVCKATLICDSIQVIRIQECPRLKKLPLHLDVPLPTSLKQIEIDREWWESSEWDNPELPQLLFPFVSFF